ncbi:MAG: hypothetical protein AB7F22_25525 [Reyranella sp.]|uniref:hypothetical protein n=1 Tax=Reyranella sp. TaxID=1929291 RepID=UPI003D0D42FB
MNGSRDNDGMNLPPPPRQCCGFIDARLLDDGRLRCSVCGQFMPQDYFDRARAVLTESGFQMLMDAIRDNGNA